MSKKAKKIKGPKHNAVRNRRGAIDRAVEGKRKKKKKKKRG